MIPKVIHYCWFGRGEKPDIIKKCIENWKTMLPDFEIIEWNEDNFDVNMYDYTKEAYGLGKWAFVSDVARLWVVYNYGGLYMDTDVEILQKTDYLYDYPAFFACQNEITVNTGYGFGAEKNHWLVKEMLDDYKDRKLIVNGKPNLTPCTVFCTDLLNRLMPECNIILESKTIKDILFISCHDYNSMFYHYSTGTWGAKPNLSGNKRKWKDSPLKRFFRNEKRLKRILNHYGTRRYKIYIFFAYDFLERGIFFYIKLLFKKIFCRKRRNKKTNSNKNN